MRIPVYALALVPLLAACHEPCDTRVDATAPSASAASCQSAGPATQRYVVVLRDDVGDPRDVATSMVRSQGTSADFIYTSSIKGFSARLSPRSVDDLRRDARVMMVEPVKAVTLTETEFRTPSWGLDRIDQRDLPLDSSYTYPRTGAGVHFYGIDSGILGTHTEFIGRTQPGFSAIDDGNGTTDCYGHGTLTASIATGTVYGVAKRMTIVPVRVLDCAGVGTTAELIAGVDWVTSNRVLPAVVNMSLAVPGGDAATDSAVARSVRTGIVYVVAAGNTNSDACLLSPAAVPSAITVGATDLADYRASFSNYGTCLDLFAPGQGITAAWISSTTAAAIADGTSMAAPHVAGVAGLYLEAYPTATPATVSAALVGNATANKIPNPGVGSPNLVLYAGFVPASTAARR